MIRFIAKITIAACLSAIACLTVAAQQGASVSVSVKNHRFQPGEIHAPANVPIELRVKNLDAALMEFERIRPLALDRYEFFDDFHPETRGALVTK